MANSALHAIAIAQLQELDPNFYAQYCTLVDSITRLIQNIAKAHPNDLDYTSFTESYDRASAEPVLQVVIGAQKNEKFVHIYIHKEKYFVIGKSGSGQTARTADQAINIIAQMLSST